MKPPEPWEALVDKSYEKVPKVKAWIDEKYGSLEEAKGQIGSDWGKALSFLYEGDAEYLGFYYGFRRELIPFLDRFGILICGIASAVYEDRTILVFGPGKCSFCRFLTEKFNVRIVSYEDMFLRPETWETWPIDRGHTSGRSYFIHSLPALPVSNANITDIVAISRVKERNVLGFVEAPHKKSVLINRLSRSAWMGLVT